MSFILAPPVRNMTMLSVWAGLQNGPLVPEGITNVTSFGVGNRRLRCGAWESGHGFKEKKEDEPRRTRRSTKKIQLRMNFPCGTRVLWWFMPLRETAPGKGFRVFGLHDCANNCTAFCSCLLKPRYRCFELWYGACYRPGGIRQQELKAVSPDLDPGFF